jgi:glycosyltransferase involved in cell wall biosynthesis
VGLTAWETSHIPRSIAIVLSELDWIIVPSNHTRQALERSGVGCPISVVPHTFDATLWPRPTPEEMHHRSDGRFVFYAIATPIERKNLLGLVVAYYRAFNADDNVVLRIKTNMDAAQAQKLLDKAASIGVGDVARDRPLVKLYPGQWSTEKIRAFHLDGNCFVSATRGEGFGLPEMEARLCGRPVITTNWGAAPEVVASTPGQQFVEATGGSGGPYRVVESGLLLGRVTQAGTEHVRMVSAYEVPVEGMYGIGCYEPDQKWADPDPVALAAAMRAAYTEGPRVDPYAWDFMQQRFGEMVVGQRFANVLREVQDSAGADEEALDGFQQPD